MRKQFVVPNLVEKAWFVQGTKLVLAVTGLRGVESAAEDLLCGRLGEELAENLAPGALSADALFEWPCESRLGGPYALDGMMRI